MNISQDQVEENYRYAAEVDIPRVEIKPEHDRIFIGLGSGSSIHDNLDNIKSILNGSPADAFFTKSGHDFFHKEGIHGGCVLLDGRQRSAEEFFSPYCLNNYYICSHVHPKMFDLTEGNYRWLFHCTKNFKYVNLFNPRGITVLGGSTSVGRMIGLGNALGYREFLFFGTDCSYNIEKEPLHPYLFCPTPPGTKTASLIVECLGKIFLTNSAFVEQMRDFDRILPKLKDNNVRFAGDGLMQWRYNNLSEDGIPPGILIHKIYKRQEK